MIPNRYRVILSGIMRFYHASGDTCELRGIRRYLPDIKSRALNVIADGPTVHVPRRSSSPAATSSTVRATSELVASGCVLRPPRPMPELVADGRILHYRCHSSSPAAVSFVIHIPRRSSTPTGVSFVIHRRTRSTNASARPPAACGLALSH
uniref:Uncharacterized protein n=1 Tax=Oryza nivara TaxID=4536 RepID=A0A0E0H5C0_ORYNI